MTYPTLHCFRVKQLVIVFEIFDFQLRFIENPLAEQIFFRGQHDNRNILQ